MKQFMENISIRVEFVTCRSESIVFEGVIFSAKSAGRVPCPGEFALVDKHCGLRVPLELGFRWEQESHVGVAKVPACAVRFTAMVPRAERMELAWVHESEEKSWHSVVHGPFSPLTERMHSSYAVLDGSLLHWAGDILVVEPATDRLVRRCERRYRLELLFRFGPTSFKSLCFRILLSWYRKRQKRDIWLFSDRVNKADDNARALFEYCCSLPVTAESPEYVFALEKGCPDWEEMSRIGKVVDLLSLKYKLVFALSRFVISAYRTQAQRMPFSKTSIALAKDIVNRPEFIFLRHGISKDDMSHDVGRSQVNARIMVSAAPREKDAILAGDYGYTDREVQLLGMPRYDLLYDCRKKNITFMPTWRRYLVVKTDAYNHALLDDFESSSYCRNYRRLFNDGRLKAASEKFGYRLRLMMHPNMVFAMNAFKLPKHFEVLPLSSRYRDIFADSGIVVTDYSSIFFDVAYLKKPIVFYHEDRDEFFAGQYEKGYFDYERDGFGEVELSVDSLVDRLIEYMENGAKMKPAYEKRVDDFFAFTDKNNCRRVYEAICEAGGKV